MRIFSIVEQCNAQTPIRT